MTTALSNRLEILKRYKTITAKHLTTIARYSELAQLGLCTINRTKNSDTFLIKLV